MSEGFDWYTIMTFNSDDHLIMNKMSFDHLGKAIENFDMHGYKLVATALPWKPSLAIENCDNTGRNCHKYGSIVDTMNTVAKNYNFTWDIYKDVNDIWGHFPIEGNLFTCLAIL